jgi:hypothetical protein
MSTSAPPQLLPSQSDHIAGSTMTQDFTPATDEINQFDYKPMPIIVPVGFVLALLSAVAFFGIIGIFIAVAATIVSFYSWRVVSQSEGTLSGRPLAIVSTVLSLGFLILGTSSEIHAYQTEVPEGYKRVSFANDISSKGFVFANGQSDLHPEVKPLIDQSVFLKGYIYPPSDPRNMKEFLLLKDTGECCFGGKPAQTDMILVKIKGDKGLDYREGLQRMSVAGHFKFDMATYGDGLLPVYQIEVDNAQYVEPSRTSF